MSLYEIVDFSGETVLELGRFGSDADALRAARNVLIRAKSPRLAKKIGKESFMVAAIPEKTRVLEDLLNLCVESDDVRISGLALKYRRTS